MTQVKKSIPTLDLFHELVKKLNRNPTPIMPISAILGAMVEAKKNSSYYMLKNKIKTKKKLMS